MIINEKESQKAPIEVQSQRKSTSTLTSTRAVNWRKKDASWGSRVSDSKTSTASTLQRLSVADWSVASSGSRQQMACSGIRSTSAVGATLTSSRATCNSRSNSASESKTRDPVELRKKSVVVKKKETKTDWSLSKTIWKAKQNQSSE